MELQKGPTSKFIEDDGSSDYSDEESLSDIDEEKDESSLEDGEVPRALP